MSGDLDATRPVRTVADAAAERRDLRERREAALAGTSMVDVVAALAERGAVVSLGLRSGRTVRARIDGVGADAVTASVAIGTDEAQLVVGLGAVTSVVALGERSPIAGVAPAGGVQLHMADILADRARERPRISAWLGSEVLVGTLVGAGRDLAVVSTDGSAGRTGEIAYVRLDSTTEISLSLSSSL